MSAKRVNIDFETRSAVDLRACGVDVYASDPTTDIVCLAYGIDDASVEIWRLGEPAPFDLFFAIEDGAKVFAWNAPFEWHLWNLCAVKKYGWPELPVDQLFCTMAMAYAMALPPALENCAKALSLDVQKDMQGARVMAQLSQPREVLPNGRVVWWDKRHAKDAADLKKIEEKFEVLYSYCKNDVVVERAIMAKLLPLSAYERRVWLLDFEINRRGIPLDMPAINRAASIVQLEKERLTEEIRQASGGEITTPEGHAQVRDFLIRRGVDVPGVAKADVAAALERKDLPESCRRVLNIRKLAAKSSTAKLEAMIKGVSKDGRIRGAFQYHGAATGRFSGRRVQFQNLPRPKLPQEKIDAAFLALEKNQPVASTIAELRSIGEPLGVISECLRGFIRAPAGRKLIVVDFSSIEARVLAWLAGQESTLSVFRGDGNLYEHAAAAIYGVDPKEITKSDPRRQIGKVAVLALGYGGGVVAFQKMALGYGVSVTDESAENIKNAWRSANGAIVNYWYTLRDAAINAVDCPGAVFGAGHPHRRVLFKMNGSFLWCRLPSGRGLCYPFPRIEDVIAPWGETTRALTYMTEDTFARKWTRVSTHGGVLAENVTQAIARDLLVDAMLRLKTRGYETVIHVHDEVVVEASKDADLHDVESILCEAPAWARDLPLGAEGFEDERYRK